MKILLFASSLSMLAGGLFSPIYAIFVEQIGGDILTAGTAYFVFSIVAGVLIFFISRWEDHLKHLERFVVAGYIIGALGYLGLLFVKTPAHLFAVQIIFGLGEAVNIPAYDGLYSKLLEKGKYASEWGIWETMAYTVTAIAALIGGIIGELYGFKALFTIMFFLSIACTIVSTALLIKGRRKYD